MLKHQSHWSGHCDSSLSTGLLPSILLSCTLNSGLAVSTESTRVLIWQPFGYVRPRDLSSTTYSNPPPTATKNSPGEKCYYEKEWLLCDSHCFIKKIFFFQTNVQQKNPKVFQSHSKNRTAHNTISQRSATSQEIPIPQNTGDAWIHYSFTLHLASAFERRQEMDGLNTANMTGLVQILRWKAASLQANPEHRP